MSDRILGGLLFLLALAFIAGATQIQSSMIFDSLGPKAFPILIGVLLAIACVYPILRPDPEPVWPSLPRLLEIGVVLVALIAYAFMLEPFGFVPATAIVAAFMSWRLGGGLLMAPVIGIAIALGIYAVFHLILGLSLARGPLGF